LVPAPVFSPFTNVQKNTKSEEPEYQYTDVHVFQNSPQTLSQMVGSQQTQSRTSDIDNNAETTQKRKTKKKKQITEQKIEKNKETNNENDESVSNNTQYLFPPSAKGVENQTSKKFTQKEEKVRKKQQQQPAQQQPEQQQTATHETNDVPSDLSLSDVIVSPTLGETHKKSKKDKKTKKTIKKEKKEKLPAEIQQTEKPTTIDESTNDVDYGHSPVLFSSQTNNTTKNEENADITTNNIYIKTPLTPPLKTSDRSNETLKSNKKSRKEKKSKKKNKQQKSEEEQRKTSEFEEGTNDEFFEKTMNGNDNTEYIYAPSQFELDN
jgi:hypothetical protein